LNKQEIISLFQSFSTKKILVIGDVMIDSYLWGKVERISPEAPVPIIASARRESRLGGAANVAYNLKEMGATPILCGIIGDNEDGELFMKLMSDFKLPSYGIFKVKNRPTTIKTRIIGGNQHLLRIDEETDKPLEGESEIAFTEHLLSILSKEKIDAIIFQDYDKGVITQRIIKSITDKANQLSIPTLVDPKKRNFLNYNGVTLFKPNFKEFTEGLKVDIKKDNFKSIHEIAKVFQTEKQIEYLLLTLSEQGVLISASDNYYHIPAHIRDIADVSGAGDTVISVASLCLAAKLNPSLLAAISNLAGGLVCEKIGVVAIEKERLLEETLLLEL